MLTSNFVALKTSARCLFLFFYLLALVFFIRRDKTIQNLLLFSLLGHFAYFMFSIGVHENHLLSIMPAGNRAILLQSIAIFIWRLVSA